MKVVEITKPVLMRMLIYGESGSGKTHLIGSFMECEDTCPVLVLNARGQPVTLRAFDPPPLVLDMETMADFNLPYRWLQLDQPSLEADTTFAIAVNAYFEKYGFTKFKTMAIDSLTHVQRISMYQLTDAADKGPGDYAMRPQRQHWGQVLGQLTRLADLYYKLPVHVVITALTRQDEVPALGAVLFGPFLWGQSSKEVPAHAEIVGRLMSIETVRAQTVTAMKETFPKEMRDAYSVLLTRGGRNFMAKWQGATNPPDVLVAPTAQKIIDIMRG